MNEIEILHAMEYINNVKCDLFLECLLNDNDLEKQEEINKKIDALHELLNYYRQLKSC